MCNGRSKPNLGVDFKGKEVRTRQKQLRDFQDATREQVSPEKKIMKQEWLELRQDQTKTRLKDILLEHYLIAWGATEDLSNSK